MSAAARASSLLFQRNQAQVVEDEAQAVLVSKRRQSRLALFEQPLRLGELALLDRQHRQVVQARGDAIAVAERAPQVQALLQQQARSLRVGRLAVQAPSAPDA